ncbi:hypothetical protein KA529_01115 [Candidatus Saccharibacteria bacterium]|nr:hypothetical protein [Candidatus Saccharibacteria bacterium]
MAADQTNAELDDNLIDEPDAEDDDSSDEADISKAEEEKNTLTSEVDSESEDEQVSEKAAEVEDEQTQTANSADKTPEAKVDDKMSSVADEGNKTESANAEKKSQTLSQLSSIKHKDTADEPVTKAGKIDVAKADAAIMAAKNPIENKPKKPSRARMTLAIIILIAVLTGLAVLFQQIVLPRVVLARYIGQFDPKLTQTAKFTVFYGDNTSDGKTKVELRAVGTVNLLKPGEESAKASIFGTVTDKEPEELDAKLIFENRNNDKTIIFNHKRPKSFLDKVLPGATTNKWTSINLSEVEQEKHQNTCVSDNIGSIYANSLKELKSIRPENIKRIGFASESVDGKKAGHYQGKFEAKTVNKITNSINSQASKICPEVFTKEISNSKVSELVSSDLKYDLWNGRDFDVLELSFVKSGKEVLKLGLTTEDYNKPVQTADSSESPLGEIDETYLLTSDDQGKTPDNELQVAINTIHEAIELDYLKSGNYVASLDLLKDGLPSDFKIPKEVEYLPAPSGCIQDCKSYELFAEMRDGKKFERDSLN